MLVNIWKSNSVTYHVNRINEKNHMTLSLDVEKAIHKIWYPFTIKAFSKLRIESNFHTLIRDNYEKPRGNILVKDWHLSPKDQKQNKDVSPYYS